MQSLKGQSAGSEGLKITLDLMIKERSFLWGPFIYNIAVHAYLPSFSERSDISWSDPSFTFVYIKHLFPFNKQFSIDSFLDWEGLHWDFSSTITSPPVSVPYRIHSDAAAMNVLIMPGSILPMEVGGWHAVVA